MRSELGATQIPRVLIEMESLVPRTHSPYRPRLLAGILALTVVFGASACSTPPEGSTPTGASPSSTDSQTSAGPASSPLASGTQVDVHRDGHDIVAYVTQGTTGTIILDAGGGNDAAYWNDLVPELAALTRATIVTYDRAGVGQSEEVPGAFSPAAAGDDLAAVIATVDRPTGPVVLVGHSIAGEVAHALVNSHPERIDGAVLIDANLPPFFTPAQVARLVEANRETVEQLKSEPSTRQNRQFIAAAENWGPVHEAFHTASWPTDLPVSVLVSDETPFAETSEDAQNWRDAAREFASQASNRDLTVAKGTSHDVPLDDQQLVESVIARMFRSL